MKRLVIASLVLCVLLVGCGSPNDENVEDDRVEALTESLKFECVVNDITSETMKTNHGVTNISNKIFNGKIIVIFKDGKGKTKDSQSFTSITIPSNSTKWFAIESISLSDFEIEYEVKGNLTESNHHISEYKHEVIFELGGNLKTIFILVDNIKEEELLDIIKEYEEKYIDSISTLNFFVPNDKITIGENPYLLDIDESAYYYPTNGKLEFPE